MNKLELRAAVTAVTLSKFVQRVLKISRSSIYFWTDSKNVLAWLHTKKWLTRFVTNRVTEIRSASALDAWRWVPGNQNPADDLSRGLNATEIAKNNRWWKGPLFIQVSHREDWPDQPDRYDTHVLDVINEKVIGVPFNQEPALKSEIEISDGIDHSLQVDSQSWSTIQRFSNWKTCVKAHCWIFRWLLSHSKGDRVFPKDRHDSKPKVKMKKLGLPDDHRGRVIDDDQASEASFVYETKKTRLKKGQVNHVLISNRSEEDPKDLAAQTEPISDSLPNSKDRGLITTCSSNVLQVKSIKTRPISANEYRETELTLIRIEQARHFAETIRQLKRNEKVRVKDHLYKLNPILDEDGILRVNARLKDHSALCVDKRSPIILPKKARITKLILLHYHNDICKHYGGTHYLLSRVRERFWPINGNTEARRIVTSCIICEVKKPRRKSQQMATLPQFRLSETGQRVAPYFHTGIDYGGPFITQQGRGKSRMKRWICLFTCMTYRAVHLEVVYSLTTESFLKALQRFIARNTRPGHLYMDNMTTFVKAETEIASWLQNDGRNEFRLRCSKEYPDIEFHFIPPGSPNYGGAWESMIKLAKRGLYDVLKPGVITDEELVTAFTIVEGLLNARPLTNVSSDPDDLKILTPAHFLIREPYKALAPLPKDFKDKERFHFLQNLMAKMWDRFLKELVPLKHQYGKNVKKVEEVAKGDIVVLLNDLDREQKWPIALVKDVHVSHDGIVRKATLIFNGREYLRSHGQYTKLKFFNWQ